MADQKIATQSNQQHHRSAMIERYEIRKRIEETHCDTCGAPLIIGDKAVCDEATMKVYCSEFCARAGERNNAPLVKPQPAGGVKIDGWDV
jgi:RNase P subunit RPR2